MATSIIKNKIIIRINYREICHEKCIKVITYKFAQFK